MDNWKFWTDGIDTVEAAIIALVVAFLIFVILLLIIFIKNNKVRKQIKRQIDAGEKGNISNIVEESAPVDKKQSKKQTKKQSKKQTKKQKQISSSSKNDVNDDLEEIRNIKDDFLESLPKQIPMEAKASKGESSLIAKARSLGIENPQEYSETRLEQLIMLKELKGPVKNTPPVQEIKSVPESKPTVDSSNENYSLKTAEASLIEKERLELERERLEIERQRRDLEFKKEQQDKALINSEKLESQRLELEKINAEKEKILKEQIEFETRKRLEEELRAKIKSESNNQNLAKSVSNEDEKASQKILETIEDEIRNLATEVSKKNEKSSSSKFGDDDIVKTIQTELDAITEILKDKKSK